MSEEAQMLLNKYQVEYIIIGDKEREAYPEIDEDGLISQGDVVFESGNTKVIKR